MLASTFVSLRLRTPLPTPEAAEAVPALQAALEDRNEFVRAAAANALREIAGEGGGG